MTESAEAERIRVGDEVRIVGTTALWRVVELRGSLVNLAPGGGAGGGTRILIREDLLERADPNAAQT